MLPLILSLLLASTTPVSTVHHPAHVVNVRAVDFSFEAPATVRPGVTTFRFTNAGTELHHLSIIRLTAGKSLDDFNSAMKSEGHPPMWATPPNHTAEVARTLHLAFEMPLEERQTRMRQMRAKIRKENIFVWRDAFYRSVQFIRDL